jgi:predicted AAA+ superfamily ATPase
MLTVPNRRELSPPGKTGVRILVLGPRNVGKSGIVFNIYI